MFLPCIFQCRQGDRLAINQISHALGGVLFFLGIEVIEVYLFQFVRILLLVFFRSGLKLLVANHFLTDCSHMLLILGLGSLIRMPAAIILLDLLDQVLDPSIVI